MKKAILLPYHIDQNEPSIPFKNIYSVPDDVAKRDQELRELFNYYVGEVDDLNDIEVYDRQSDDDYGDVIVTYDEVFLYVTFVE